MGHIFVRLSYFCALGLVVAALCVDLPALAGNSSQNANSSTTNRAAEAAPSAEPTNMQSDASEETDLSGTYTGTFNCPDAGVSGETTLTISGNTFTLSDGKTGRITARTTRGYTGVAMQFGELVMATATSPGTAPVIVSMRARKSGDRLTLSTVPNARQVCAFTPKR